MSFGLLYEHPHTIRECWPFSEFNIHRPHRTVSRVKLCLNWTIKKFQPSQPTTRHQNSKGFFFTKSVLLVQVWHVILHYHLLSKWNIALCSEYGQTDRQTGSNTAHCHSDNVSEACPHTHTLTHTHTYTHTHTHTHTHTVNQLCSRRSVIE